MHKKCPMTDDRGPRAGRHRNGKRGRVAVPPARKTSLGIRCCPTLLKRPTYVGLQTPGWCHSDKCSNGNFGSSQKRHRKVTVYDASCS
jgi:hypothetical protein